MLKQGFCSQGCSPARSCCRPARRRHRAHRRRGSARSRSARTSHRCRSGRSDAVRSRAVDDVLVRAGVRAAGEQRFAVQLRRGVRADQGRLVLGHVSRGPLPLSGERVQRGGVDERVVQLHPADQLAPCDPGPVQDRLRRLSRAPGCARRRPAQRGRSASTSTPGLSTPAGSTAALAPRRAAANGSGRWRSYQGRWSRPTAWWWVIVPPAAITASEAAALIASHSSTWSRPFAGARIVK